LLLWRGYFPGSADTGGKPLVRDRMRLGPRDLVTED